MLPTRPNSLRNTAHANGYRPTGPSPFERALDRSFTKAPVPTPAPAQRTVERRLPPLPPPPAVTIHDDRANEEQLVRTFNTAIVSTHTVAPDRNIAQDLQKLMRSPAYRVAVMAAEELARRTGVTLLEASKQVIEALQSMDKLWVEYLIQQGLERIRSQKGDSIQAAAPPQAPTSGYRIQR